MYPIETINYILALATIVMQVVGVGFLAIFFLRTRFPDLGDVGAFLTKWGMWGGLLVSLAGIALTLLYSEVIGYVPCGLCWLVRIFLYPQAILFAIALWKRDRSVVDYSIALSAFGFVVALYAHYLQMGGASLVPCPASGVSDCARRFVFEFGYVTLPMMGVTLFAFLIVLMLFVRKRN